MFNLNLKNVVVTVIATVFTPAIAPNIFRNMDAVNDVLPVQPTVVGRCTGFPFRIVSTSDTILIMIILALLVEVCHFYLGT